MSRRAQLLLSIIFLQALVAIAGSLFFSNVLGYAPCDLCWYQRIAMYPQLFIAFAALWRKEMNALWYGLPLALAGLLVSVYHASIYVLTNYGHKSLSVQCSISGVSCTTPYLIWGIPVPFLSLAALVVTVVCYLLLAQELKKA